MDQTQSSENQVPKKKFPTVLVVVAIIVLLIVIGSITSKSSNKNTNGSTTNQSQNTNNASNVNNTNTEQASYPDSIIRIIPESVKGTTQNIMIIVSSSITDNDLITTNDELVRRNSSGLTHLTIEYFDDESVANEYFQKILTVSETEGDAMFTHYRATYKLNTVSGLNQLSINKDNDWVVSKNY